MTEGYRGVKALVFGATGFVGRWVARRLTAEGARLTLVVRDPGTAAETLARYGARGEVRQADLSVAGAAAAVVKAVGADVVFNLAGYGVDPAEREEAMARRINRDLVEEMAGACAGLEGGGWRGLRLVHTGSALEYGAIGGEVTEDRRPNPTTLYGKTKLEGTLALQAVCGRTGLAAVTARLFQVYGAGEHPARLLPSLIAASKDKTDAPLALTSGKQRRDFVSLEDAVEGLLRLGRLDGRETQGFRPGMVVNLGTGNLTEVRQFVRMAARVLELREARLQFGALPTRTEEMEYEAVSIDRLELLLGWRPPSRMEEGIRQAVRCTFEMG